MCMYRGKTRWRSFGLSRYDWRGIADFGGTNHGMNTLVSEHTVLIRGVTVTGDTLEVDLTDGRSVAVPLAWYPRLVHGTVAERQHWELIAHGEGIHWPQLDEDISLEGIMAGRPSAESQQSLQRWMQARTK